MNIDDFGTLIASMARLISFKLIRRENKAIRSKYLLYFIAINIAFLLISLRVYVIIINKRF